MNTITKGDFLQMVKLQHLEVLTQEQMQQNTQILKSYIEKSLTSELDATELASAHAMMKDVSGFDAWQVLRDDFSKAVVYTRQEQVVWEEPERGEFGEIVKAKSGVYKPTAENKKKGVVGQKYGKEHEDEFGNKKHQPTDEKEYRAKESKEELKQITSEFDVRDALGGDMSGDYKKDLARVEKNSKKTFTKELYEEAYQNQEQP